MIVQVVGTSGAGKSYLMRKILAYAKKNGVCLPVKKDDKTHGYELNVRGWRKPTYVLGAYDVPTGGCDTTRSAVEIFDQLPGLHAQYDVLCEGLFIMNMTRAPVLAAELGRDYCVIMLTTPLGTCYASINQRRNERGEGELVNHKNTQDNYRRARNYTSEMRDAGAAVFRLSRAAAQVKVLELLEQQD